MENILDKYTNLDLQIFVVANRHYWPLFESHLKHLPFPRRMVDPAMMSGQEFIREMILLNEKAYGKHMAAPAWTFANFGSIASGISAGFLSKGHPISKLTLVGTLANEKISHEWTLLVDPEFEKMGLGTLTFALALELVRDKDYHTFILQTDNASANIYLKNPYPLCIQAYGFVHTAHNSMFIKTQIPKPNPFEILMSQPAVSYEYSDFPLADNAQFNHAQCAWFLADNHSLFLEINEEIQKGHAFNFKGKTIKDGKIFLLIEKTS